MPVGFSSFPGSLDTADTLVRVTDDGWATELRRAITADESTLPVMGTDGAPPSGVLDLADPSVDPSVGSGVFERVSYSGKTADSFTGVLRGQFLADGAGPARAWPGGAVVKFRLNPTMHRVLADAIMATQSVVGVGGAGYTDEQARDAVGAMLADTASVDLTHDDAANAITADVKYAGTGGDLGAAATAARSDHAHDADYVELAGDTMTGQLGIADAAVATQLRLGPGLGATTSVRFLAANAGAGFDAGIVVTGGTGTDGQGEIDFRAASLKHNGAAIGGGGVAVEEEDAVVVAAAAVLDFDGSDFNVASEAGNEARISLAYGVAAGTPAEGNHTHGGEGTPVWLTVPFAAALNDAAAESEWANMPAAVTELFGQDRQRQRVDLANATQARLVVRVGAVAGAAGSKLYLQYSTDESAWSDVGATAQTDCSLAAANATADSGWVDLAAGAKVNNCYLRVVGSGGNGTADPRFWLVVGYFKVPAGTALTVQEEDATTATGVSTLDFDGSDFNLADEGAGEVRVALNYGAGAGQPAEGNHAHAALYQPLDADLTAIAGLADPNADRILFWDDSAGAYAHLTPGTNLTITATTIDAAGGGGGAVAVEEEDSVVVAAAAVLDFDGSDFNVASEAGNEARIALAYGTGAGTPAEGNHNHDAAYVDVAGDTMTGNLTLRAGAAGAGASPVKFQSGANLTAPEAGAVEYDGANFFGTANATSGRGDNTLEHVFRLSANGSAIGPAIADFFGANSAISLPGSSAWELEAVLYYLKTTAGTVVYTITNSAANYANVAASYVQSAVGGIATNAAQTGAGVVGVTTAAAALPATASLTTAVNHRAVLRATVEMNAAGNLRVRVTSSAGTVTPLRGSYFKIRRLPANTGSFVA